MNVRGLIKWKSLKIRVSKGFKFTILVAVNTSTRELFYSHKQKEFKDRISKSQQLFFTKFKEVQEKEQDKIDHIKENAFFKYEKQVKFIILNNNYVYSL